MRIFAAALLPLALTVLPALADETFESTVSGTVTIAVAPATPAGVNAPDLEPLKSGKSLTIRLVAPSPEAAEPDLLRQCGMKWNKKLADHDKKQKAAEEKKKLPGPHPGQGDAKPKPLTRADYRSCMYQCLGDTTRQDPDCQPAVPAEAQRAPASGPAHPSPAGP